MMWKKRGNDLDQSNGFVMLPLSNVVGLAKTFFVTRHEQVTLVTYSKFVIVNGIPGSRVFFQIGVVYMEHFRKVKKEVTALGLGGYDKSVEFHDGFVLLLNMKQTNKFNSPEIYREGLGIKLVEVQISRIETQICLNRL
ncbi:hypothetical protein P5673_000881 [Acropora cervicornis]|uniref:Uncharacterized protein n=1 Tax=Acropora cervicornis TaxID=6130 RepID=A0AAD9VGP2_ACRCE|nr:hypothetical protein P5673_000881 [Acropora cervicornis]